MRKMDVTKADAIAKIGQTEAGFACAPRPGRMVYASRRTHVEGGNAMRSGVGWGSGATGSFLASMTFLYAS